MPIDQNVLNKLDPIHRCIYVLSLLGQGGSVEVEGLVQPGTNQHAILAADILFAICLQDKTLIKILLTWPKIKPLRLYQYVGRIANPKIISMVMLKTKIARLQAARPLSCCPLKYLRAIRFLGFFCRRLHARQHLPEFPEPLQPFLTQGTQRAMLIKAQSFLHPGVRAPIKYTVLLLQ